MKKYQRHCEGAVRRTKQPLDVATVFKGLLRRCAPRNDGYARNDVAEFNDLAKFDDVADL